MTTRRGSSLVGMRPPGGGGRVVAGAAVVVGAGAGTVVELVAGADWASVVDSRQGAPATVPYPNPSRNAATKAPTSTLATNTGQTILPRSRHAATRQCPGLGPTTWDNPVPWGLGWDRPWWCWRASWPRGAGGAPPTS